MLSPECRRFDEDFDFLLCFDGVFCSVGVAALISSRSSFRSAFNLSSNDMVFYFCFKLMPELNFEQIRESHRKLKPAAMVQSN